MSPAITRLVSEADSHAELILTKDESRMTFSEMIATRQRAAMLLQELVKVIRMEDAEKIEAQKADARKETAPTPTEKRKPFPSFDDWHKQKYNRTFQQLWQQPGMDNGIALVALMAETRQYLGELAAYTQNMKPEDLDKSLYPWHHDVRYQDKCRTTEVHKSEYNDAAARANAGL